MSIFERIYQIDPLREARVEIERSSIELSDEDYLGFIQGKKMIKAVIDSIDQEIAEQKDYKHAKSASKSLKKTAKKGNTKSNKPAVARVQKEL